MRMHLRETECNRCRQVRRYDDDDDAFFLMTRCVSAMLGVCVCGVVDGVLMKEQEQVGFTVRETCVNERRKTGYCKISTISHCF